MLLVDARTRGTAESAEVWDAEGAWVRSGRCGDAVEHVLVTSRGDFWVGYFDEAAASGRGLGGHGLVRFGTDLQPRWRYPFDALIGGYGADYDLVTPGRIDAQGVQAAGGQSRVVLPDGMEIRNARWTCRGPELHALIDGSWYRASLDDFHPAA